MGRGVRGVERVCAAYYAVLKAMWDVTGNHYHFNHIAWLAWEREQSKNEKDKGRYRTGILLPHTTSFILIFHLQVYHCIIQIVRNGRYNIDEWNWYEESACERKRNEREREDLAHLSPPLLLLMLLLFNYSWVSLHQLNCSLSLVLQYSTVVDLVTCAAQHTSGPLSAVHSIQSHNTAPISLLFDRLHLITLSPCLLLALDLFYGACLLAVRFNNSKEKKWRQIKEKKDFAYLLSCTCTCTPCTYSHSLPQHSLNFLTYVFEHLNWEIDLVYLLLLLL